MTNQKRSFFACILKISNCSIILKINVYECNNWLYQNMYGHSRSYFWVKFMPWSNKFTKMCILTYTMDIPNIKKDKHNSC